MNKERILITGARGLVGSHFFENTLHKEELLVPPREALNLESRESIATFFKDNASKFDVVVNFAAITQVDASESEQNDINGTAWKVNTVAPLMMSELSDRYRVYFLHISTDFVFPGTVKEKGPYSEEHQPGEDEDLSWYAITKRNGECLNGNNNSVVRISYPYRESHEKEDFVRKMVRLSDEGKLPHLFNNQYITPTYIHELTRALDKLISDRLTGIYHVASRDITTPYEFISEVLTHYNKGTRNALPSSFFEDYTKAAVAKRPQYGGLNSEETQRSLGFSFMHTKVAAEHIAKRLRRLQG